jgi:hypothetical protein
VAGTPTSELAKLSPEPDDLLGVDGTNELIAKYLTMDMFLPPRECEVRSGITVMRREMVGTGFSDANVARRAVRAVNRPEGERRRNQVAWTMRPTARIGWVGGGRVG